MATRTKIKPPTDIKTVDDWVAAYRGRYTNVVMENGELAVLDKAGERVKTIPMAQGADYLTLFASEDLDSQTRAAAHQEELEHTIKERQASAQAAFLDAQAELLRATDVWNGAVDPAARREAAVEVGRQSIQIEEAERALMEATYPHRSVCQEVMPKITLDYASRDERTMMLSRLKTFRRGKGYKLADRILYVERITHGRTNTEDRTVSL